MKKPTTNEVARMITLWIRNANDVFDGLEERKDDLVLDGSVVADDGFNQNNNGGLRTKLRPGETDKERKEREARERDEARRQAEHGQDGEHAPHGRAGGDGEAPHLTDAAHDLRVVRLAGDSLALGRDASETARIARHGGYRFDGDTRYRSRVKGHRRS